jgi:hypothetical protein
MASSAAVLSAAETLSPASFMVFSVVWISESAWLRASTEFAALLVLLGVISASLTICSMSASLRPLEAWMRICCSLPVALSLAADVDDAVGVDVEGDLDLRHAARRRRNADQIELAEQLVVAAIRARPGTRGWSPRSGCPRRSRTPGSSWSGWWCCGRSAG